jgi:hypothetical protein
MHFPFEGQFLVYLILKHKQTVKKVCWIHITSTNMIDTGSELLEIK